MLAGYASVVAQPRIIEWARAGRLSGVLLANAAGAGGVCLVLALVGTFVLPRLVPFLFGAAFVPTVAVAQVLLAGSCADMFFMPVPMTFVLQMWPRTALWGEAAITLFFLGMVGAAGRAGVVEMAWLATAVRVLKLVFYGGLAWARRDRLTLPIAATPGLAIPL